MAARAPPTHRSKAPLVHPRSYILSTLVRHSLVDEETATKVSCLPGFSHGAARGVVGQAMGTGDGGQGGSRAVHRRVDGWWQSTGADRLSCRHLLPVQVQEFIAANQTDKPGVIPAEKAAPKR